MNQTWPHCVNQIGKTHSKPLAAWHGMAGKRHAMCESALMLPRLLLPKFAYKRSPILMPVGSAGSSDSELLELQSMWFISCNVTNLTAVRHT